MGKLKFKKTLLKGRLGRSKVEKVKEAKRLGSKKVGTLKPLIKLKIPEAKKEIFFKPVSKKKEKMFSFK